MPGKALISVCCSLATSLLWVSSSTLAQAPQEIRACANELLQLNTTPGYDEYAWAPRAAALWVQGPRAGVRLTESQVFTIRGRRRLPREYVLDPGFDQGAAGVASALALVEAPAFPSASYAIVASAAQLQGDHSPCPNVKGDKDGRFMAIHGEAFRNIKAWCQRVDVEQDAEYDLRYVVAALDPAHLPVITLTADSTRIGLPRTTDPYPCVWRAYSGVWRAPRTATVEVCLNVASPSSGGSRLGIDNISIKRFDRDLLDTICVKVIPVPDTTQYTAVVCSGERFREGGLDLGAGETGTLRYALATGCDSVVRVEVEAIDAFRQNLSYRGLCSGTPFRVPGYDLTVSRDTTVALGVYESAGGCDSVVTADIDFFDDQDASITQVDPSCGAPVGTVILTAADSLGLTYAWSDQGPAKATREDIRAGTAGWVEATNRNGCRQRFGYRLKASTRPRAEATVLKVPTCPDSADGVATLTLGGGNFPVVVTFVGGTGSAFTAGVPEARLDRLAPGSYRLLLVDARGCRDTLTLDVPSPGGPSIQIEGPTQIPLGIPGVYSVRIDGPVGDGAVGWRLVTPYGEAPLEPSRGTVSLRPPSGGVLVVDFTDVRGCTFYDSLAISLEASGGPLFPSAFSPNGDGLHDVFVAVEHPGLVATEELLIYDRWGSLVARASGGEGERVAWTGSGMNPGSYIYVARLRFADGSVITQHGAVTLML